MTSRDIWMAVNNNDELNALFDVQGAVYRGVPNTCLCRCTWIGSARPLGCRYRPRPAAEELKEVAGKPPSTYQQWLFQQCIRDQSKKQPMYKNEYNVPSEYKVIVDPASGWHISVEDDGDGCVGLIRVEAPRDCDLTIPQLKAQARAEMDEDARVLLKATVTDPKSRAERMAWVAYNKAETIASVIPRKAFERVVMEVGQDYNIDLDYKAETFEVFQIAIENGLLGLFAKARQTIEPNAAGEYGALMPRHLQAAR